MQEIKSLAEVVKVPAGKRNDLHWMRDNLRSHAHKDKACCCETKVLLNYVQIALQQGIDNLSG